MILIIIIILLSLFLFCKNYLKSLVDNVTPRTKNMYVKKSIFGGTNERGVFASVDFNINDILELAPYIEDDKKNFIGVINDYAFKKNTTLNSIIAFGYISLCNHNDNPNTKWIIENDYMILYAVKPIKKDEEIFVSYGEPYWTSRPTMKKV
jgi:hypothetical protein